MDGMEWLELKTGLLVMRSLGSTRLGEGVERLEFAVIGLDEYATEPCVQGIRVYSLRSCLAACYRISDLADVGSGMSPA